MKRARTIFHVTFMFAVSLAIAAPAWGVDDSGSTSRPKIPKAPKVPKVTVIQSESSSGSGNGARAVVVQSDGGIPTQLTRDSIYAREISIDISGIRILDREGRLYVLPAHRVITPGAPDLSEVPGFSAFDVVVVNGDTIHVQRNQHDIHVYDSDVPNDQVTQLASNIEVREDEVVRGDVVCIFCDIDVAGEVTGSAVSVFGNVSVEGRVGNEAVAPFGRVQVGPEGHIRSDVFASKIVREPGGRIDGGRQEVFFNFLGGDDGLGEAWTRSTFTIIVVLKILFWLFLVLLAHALAAKNIVKVKDRIQRSYFKSFLMGVLGQILLIPVFLLLLVTIIGIPVALFVLPLMLFGGMVLAQAAVGQLVGDKIAENTSLPLKTPLARTITGVAALQIFAYLTIVFIWPAGHGSSGGAFRLVTLVMFVLSAIMGYVVMTLGTGSVILTRFGTRPKEVPAASEIPTIPPIPPIPSIPDIPDPAVTPLPFEPRRPDNPGTAPVS